MTRIRVMSGRCPVALPVPLIGDVPQMSDLADWFHEVQDWGRERGCDLTREAIIQWADTLSVFLSDEAIMIRHHLQLVVPEDITS